MKNIPNTKYKIQDTKMALTGGAAAAEALRQINPEVMAVYPITPQTPIIETYSKMKADGEVDTEVIQVESEHSAISACVGASAAGVRSVTATSSQGLALMQEILYVASGMRLPILMVVSARALSAPINIHGDHSDVMGARDSGWIQLFAENVQEVYDLTFIGLRLAEKAKLPVMVIMDGFNTSHSVENLEVLDDKVIKSFIGEYEPKDSLLDIKNPKTFGPLALQNSYFEFKIDQVQAMEESSVQLEKVTREFEKISGRSYSFLEKYKTREAEKLLVMMGSASGTAKEVIDKMRKEGEKVGLVKLSLFRPFPEKELRKALEKADKVAVLDRAMSMGTQPPLFLETKNSLSQEKDLRSYVFGLGGRDIFEKDFIGIFQDLDKKSNERIKYIQ